MTTKRTKNDKPESVRIKTNLPNKWVVVSADPCIGISFGGGSTSSVEYVSLSAAMYEITDLVNFKGGYAPEDNFRNRELCWKRDGIWEANRKTVRWEHRTMAEAKKHLPALVKLAKDQLAAKGLLGE